MSQLGRGQQIAGKVVQQEQHPVTNWFYWKIEWYTKKEHLGEVLRSKVGQRFTNLHKN